MPLVLPGVLRAVKKTSILPQEQNHAVSAIMDCTRAAAQQISETRARRAQPVNDATARLW